MSKEQQHRAWGQAQDQEAARQLGLQGDYTIFMMSYEVEYMDDLDAIEEEMRDLGVVYPKEVIDAIEERQVFVKLPKGYVLVGMVPTGEDHPKTYGIVDFSMFIS
jgi:hypothetical protein